MKRQQASEQKYGSVDEDYNREDSRAKLKALEERRVS